MINSRFDLTAFREVDDLLLDGQYSEAIRRLQVHLKSRPADPEALVRLAEALDFLDQPAAVLGAAEAALAAEPNHLRALCFAASALIDLGRPGEALIVIERAIQIFDALSPGDEGSRSPRAQRSRLYWLNWSALRAIGNREAALAVAREGYRVDSARRWEILESLLEMDRFEEAENVDGPGVGPVAHAQVLWDIAFHLVDQERYATALPYFLRNLAFRTLPRDFRYLQAYLECLACAGRYEELRLLADHWLDAGRVRQRTRRRLLQALLAVAYAGEGRLEEAHERVAAVCGERSLEQCLRLFRGCCNFEASRVAIERAFASALATAAPPAPTGGDDKTAAADVS